MMYKSSGSRFIASNSAQFVGPQVEDLQDHVMGFIASNSAQFVGLVPD